MRSTHDLEESARPDWFVGAVDRQTTFTIGSCDVTEITVWPISLTFVRPATTPSTPNPDGAMTTDSSCVSPETLRVPLHTADEMCILIDMGEVSETYPGPDEPVSISSVTFGAASVSADEFVTIVHTNVDHPKGKVIATHPPYMAKAGVYLNREDLVQRIRNRAVYYRGNPNAAGVLNEIADDLETRG